MGSFNMKINPQTEKELKDLKLEKPQDSMGVTQMIKEELLQAGDLFSDKKSLDGTLGKAQEKRESFKKTMNSKEINELFEEETRVLMGSFKEEQLQGSFKRPGTTGVGARPSNKRRANRP